jgi:hypothetical protein
LSTGCARCHDHKFDPIPSQDYYHLAATFTTAIRTEIEIDQQPQENARRRARYNAEVDRLTRQLQRLAQNTADSSSAALLEQWKLFQQLAGQRKAGPGLQLTKVMITSEGGPPMKHHADGRGFPHFYPQTHFLRRGDVHQKGEVATPGFLQVLLRDGYGPEQYAIKSPPEPSHTSFRRAALAHWITDADHGAGHLAARVIVNRLWQHHFGRGIVATPNDFGAAGERPTHPELLDWLARDLVEHGWQLKRLHKLIMTSSVYLQSIDHDEERAKIDRENVLLWRRVPRRLEAEAIRDCLLAVSGQLDRTMYGAGTLDPNMRRRSVYFFIKRSQLIPMMMLFDWPEHLVSIAQRGSTTIAPQALLFLNSSQTRQYAEGLARRVAEDRETARGREGKSQIHTAYWLALGREPSPTEARAARDFMTAQAEAYSKQGVERGEAVRRAWVDFCQTLLATNEFLYVD